MSAVTATAAKLTIPPEVHEFVRERGLEPYFPQIVAILQRLFADATKLEVEVHQDPEVEGLKWLIFDVTLTWDSLEQIQSLKKEWYRQTGAICPSWLRAEFSICFWES